MINFYIFNIDILIKVSEIFLIINNWRAFVLTYKYRFFDNLDELGAEEFVPAMILHNENHTDNNLNPLFWFWGPQKRIIPFKNVQTCFYDTFPMSNSIGGKVKYIKKL